MQRHGREEWERAAHYGYEVQEAARGLDPAGKRGWKGEEKRKKDPNSLKDVDIKTSELFARKMKLKHALAFDEWAAQKDTEAGKRQ